MSRTRLRRATRSTGALVGLFAILGLGPLLLLAYLAVTLATGAVRKEAEGRVGSTAAAAGQAVSTDLGDLSALVGAYARRPSLVRAIEDGDSVTVAFHLADLKAARTGIATAFVATMEGRLVEIVPATPAIVGDDFSFRDWYRGVTESGRPYVSEAYVTQAAGHERVVAAATIVRGSGGTPVGILVGAFELEHVQRYVDGFATSQGVDLMVTDQRGTLVAAPGALTQGLASRGADPRVRSALRGGSGVLEHDGELSAFVPVRSLGWTVTASVSTDEAFARVDTLRRTVLAITGLLALLLALALAFLARTLIRRRAAEAESEASRQELEVQNRELEEQQIELEAQQAELESATVELEEQRGELEHVVDKLEVEQQRIRSLYEFGRSLTAQTELERLATVILSAIAESAEAEIGALYVLGDDSAYRPAAGLGLDPARLARVKPGEGLPGRALAELEPVRAGRGASGLSVPAFGEDVVVGAELHVPLVQGGRPVAVVSLARVGDRPFSAEDVAAVRLRADQAGSALYSVRAFAELQHFATVTRAVLDGTVDGIFMLDREGNFVVHNAAVAALASERGRAVEGNIYEHLESVAEGTADPARYLEFWRAVQADPELVTTEEVTLTDLRRTFHLHTAPVRSEAGDLLGRLFTLHDITAEREADRLKSDLVATVSHELRTPLASILGFSELLVHRDLDEGTKARYLATISNEAQRLTALINDFLDLQRIEDGQFTLALETFDLAELLRHEAQLFSGQSSAHEIQLELPSGELAVVGERDRLAQVLANLISNAIKYSPAGGPVSIDASAGDGFVRVSVGDRGLGIPAAAQSRIFTKFFRVDSSDTREIGGTGLGLALAKEIVDAHGGHIGFESVEGEGSTFWFELPSGRRTGRARGRRVLIVEDDPASAQLLADHLAGDGCAVTIAATGKEGLARAAADLPDLVCLDIRLPGELDGWQVLERLKAEPDTAAIPVIVCTGDNGRHRAGALGAADFLTKPFSPSRLRQTMDRILPERRGTVLVVDDDAAVRRLVADSLGHNGISLREAADGAAALRAVEENRPDAIVLDLVMPELDGFGVLERLQGDGELRTIPVVVLTAKRLSADERGRLSTQAVSLLEKSAYSADELRRLVDRALGA